MFKHDCWKQCSCKYRNFANMSTFHTEDDVLTLLIHLGYAAYDYDNKTVQIPNNEVRAEYVNSVSASTGERGFKGCFIGYPGSKSGRNVGRSCKTGF